jgi:hypothetical protein
MERYERGVIYKICCRDPRRTECYVGSTCNLVRRRCSHKHMCHNERRVEYSYPLYRHIRENGGWENWEVVPVEEYPCASKTALRIREQYWIETLGAALNACGAMAKDTREENARRSREWYARNAQARHDYYVKNRDAVLVRAKQKASCECGAVVSRANLANHRKTEKHRAQLST